MEKYMEIKRCRETLKQTHGGYIQVSHRYITDTHTYTKISRYVDTNKHNEQKLYAAPAIYLRNILNLLNAHTQLPVPKENTLFSF